MNSWIVFSGPLAVGAARGFFLSSHPFKMLGQPLAAANTMEVGQSVPINLGRTFMNSTHTDPFRIRQSNLNGSAQRLIEKAGKKATLGFFAFNGCATDSDDLSKLACEFFLAMGMGLLIASDEFLLQTAKPESKTEEIIEQLELYFGFPLTPSASDPRDPF